LCSVFSWCTLLTHRRALPSCFHHVVFFIAQCFPALEQLCDHEKANRTLCIKCVDENAATLKKDNCTYEDIDKFCDITPPAYTCKDVLERDCAVDRKNESLCMKCIARHANETAKAKCTETEEKEVSTLAFEYAHIVVATVVVVVVVVVVVTVEVVAVTRVGNVHHAMVGCHSPHTCCFVDMCFVHVSRAHS